MKKSVSPWIAQFDDLLTRDAIKLRAEYIPDCATDLHSLPTHIASAKLFGILNEVIALSEPDLDVLQRLVQRSHAYALEAYSNVPHFLATMHSKEFQINSPLPICLTGLAGTGKSTLFTAFQRALPSPTSIQVGPAIVDQELQLISHARINVKSSRNFQDFLAPFLPVEFEGQEKEIGNFYRGLSNQEKNNGVKKISPGNSIKYAIRNSYKMGSFSTLVDEMQFVTQDSKASATPTKILLMMSYINAPLIFAANYSLCNKLLRRNQEDRDRLLGDVIVIRPLELNENGLGSLLKIYDRILGECIDGSLCKFLPEYTAMTLGIKRKVRELTIAAFNEMRKNRDSKLSRQHIKTAYERRLPLPFRKDIEALHQINGMMRPAGVDINLWCPFGIEYNRFSLPSSFMDDTTEKEVTKDILRQSLTGSEKKLVAAFERHNRTPSPHVNPDEIAIKPKTSKRKSEHSASDLISRTVAHRDRS